MHSIRLKCQPGLIRMQVVPAKCCTESSTCITRCWLDPQLVEDTGSQELAIRDTIECNTTSQTQIALSGLRRDTTRQTKYDVLCHSLN